MAVLEVNEPADDPIFQSYKACSDLFLGSPQTVALPTVPLFPVQTECASSGSVRKGRLEAEAYCRSNNVMVFEVSSSEALWVCWGQAGLHTLRVSGSGSQEWLPGAWQEICSEPVLSAVRVDGSRENKICRVAFSLCSGKIAIASIEFESDLNVHLHVGSIPDESENRLWLSSARQSTSGDSTNILAYSVVNVGRQMFVKLLLLTATAETLSSQLLQIEVAQAYFGSSLPRASCWSAESSVLVIAMGRFDADIENRQGCAVVQDGCDELMEDSGPNSPKRSRGQDVLTDSDTAILTVLPASSQKDKISARTWSLPRGDLLMATNTASPNTSLQILLERGRDALALDIALSDDVMSGATPILTCAPRRLPGLASVASARQNLRLCLTSPALTFVALCELTGLHAASVFRTPSSGAVLSPTCHAALDSDDEVIGGQLFEDALCILTPRCLLRFRLDASVEVIGAAPPLRAKNALPHGIDAAALLRMLDSMED